MTAAAITTAIACLGIGGLGYLLRVLHERSREDRRPGYLPVPMAAAVDNWVGYPYDQQRTDEPGTAEVAS